MRWKILKKVAGDKLGLRVLRKGPEQYLEIDLFSIPEGMSIEEYTAFIQRTGIVLNGNYNRYKARKR